MSESAAPFVHERALVETNRIGAGTRVWAFAHVMAGAVIGRNCSIGDHAFVESGVTLGDNVTVKNGVAIWEHVRIADNVFLGPHAVLTNDRHPRRDDSPYEAEETCVEEGVTVGANATIVCGVRLGRRCFVGAGSVVTADVPPHALVFGNPARQHGWVCHCARPLAVADGAAAGTCGKCGRRYRVTDSGLAEST